MSQEFFVPADHVVRSSMDLNPGRSGRKGAACGSHVTPRHCKSFQVVGIGSATIALEDRIHAYTFDWTLLVAFDIFRPMAAHDHDHEEGSNLSEMELRVRALETILVEKGYVETAALDRIIELYETKIGPHIGVQVIAKAWTDPSFRESLLQDASKAVSALAEVGRVGDHLIAVENTPQVHNMVVCTLCSCYPTDVLGLPPTWYKSFPYRSRVVKEPRAVLADFGVTLPAETEIRVWDSTAETRFLVVPMRPAGTEGWSEAQLAKLITRDSMIGAGLPKNPSEVA